MTDTQMQVANLIIQTIISVAMVSTFLVYYFQLRTMRSASAAQSILSLVTFLQATDVRTARGVVRKDLVNKTRKDWSDEEEFHASLVCSSYDVAAILIRKGLVEPETFLDNWGPSIKHCYEVLREYVQEMQKPENSGPHYWNDFCWLYEQVVSGRSR
jgi:hypothetical protein